MWSWCSRTCIGQVLLLPHGVYKELTCEFLVDEVTSMELDRAELDQGLGWITFLARERRKMVTFRQLEICLGSLWRRNQWNIKEDELQRVGLQSLRGTLPQGPRLLRSGAQCLRYVHKALANTFFARKALDNQ
ncbi:unnamed protein product [Microthlaspi erraticum]|uniref:Arabidopsis retrotransposon Orf1 C-terminal domain-containing protein n=1 Tax=Microthlaspi erraticum TaxID=1685480 RepID=A0A6D2KB34_9BRAS|nr:unnamed protein product [Microthlaspi erraticum]